MRRKLILSGKANVHNPQVEGGRATCLKKMAAAGVCSIFMCLLAGGSAYADESHFSNKYQQCMERAGSAEDAFNCMDKEVVLLDKKIAVAFKRVMAKLSGLEEKSVLRKSQIAWEQYREASCEVFQILVMGDTSKLSCLMEKQAARIKELKEMEDN